MSFYAQEYLTLERKDIKGSRGKKHFPVASLPTGWLSFCTGFWFLIQRGHSSRRETSNALIFKDLEI